jgi:hypothetical protein
MNKIILGLMTAVLTSYVLAAELQEVVDVKSDIAEARKEKRGRRQKQIQRQDDAAKVRRIVEESHEIHDRREYIARYGHAPQQTPPTEHIYLGYHTDSIESSDEEVIAAVRKDKSTSERRAARWRAEAAVLAQQGQLNR